MAGDSAGLNIFRLGPEDLPLLLTGSALFDDPLRPDMAARFLAHSDHHLFGAVADGTMIGFVSAVTYLHPDKPLEIWLNEVGVEESWQRRGIGRLMVMAALGHGWSLGCGSAWVLTNSGNGAARGLYAACGGMPSPAARHREGVVMYSFAPPG